MNTFRGDFSVVNFRKVLTPDQLQYLDAWDKEVRDSGEYAWLECIVHDTNDRSPDDKDFHIQKTAMVWLDAHGNELPIYISERQYEKLLKMYVNKTYKVKMDDIYVGFITVSLNGSGKSWYLDDILYDGR